MLAHPARDLNRQPAAYIVLDGVVVSTATFGAAGCRFK